MQRRHQVAMNLRYTTGELQAGLVGWRIVERQLGG